MWHGRILLANFQNEKDKKTSILSDTNVLIFISQDLIQENIFCMHKLQRNN